ncbi:MAG TPA: HNH endonuclease domain-containing protein [Methylomirabilota bacterium]|nr:HNH endonuclease domain-containing protein [Methylomirabilota bacterium]
MLGNDVDPLRDRDAWRALPCPAIQLPKRYHGGLLFGQVIPRFENRIIGVCPIWFSVCRALFEKRPEIADSDPLKHEKESAIKAFDQWLPKARKQNGRRPLKRRKTLAGLLSEFATQQSKLPSKATREFLRYRWAMQIANIFGAKPGEPKTRPLNADERKQLTALAEKQGTFTKGEFKDAVRQITGWPEKPPRDNLDALLLHPDAEKALVLDPARAEIRKSKLTAALDALPERFRKRLYGQLTRGKAVTLATVRSWLTGADADAFDAEIQRVLDAANTKRSKKQAPPTREELLAEELCVDWKRVAAGRAAYARPVLRQAYEEVMQGIDPRAEKDATQPRGCLCQTDELKEAQLQRRLEEQTNNHLIRHRLLILERLLNDIIAAPEFANGDKSRIAAMTIEVARDLRDLSGKTREKQAEDLRDRLRNFKSVAAKVEEACRRRGIRVSASIIRKARVAEDLGWRCPYTGKDFNIDTLLDGVMDKEHIIPHADRQSDSLDSLVITWNEVNKWKGKRTAMQFIREEGGKPVPGRPELSVMSLAAYQKHVASLDIRKGHDDDRARKKRRIRRLLTETYEEKEFTQRDLTVTSHLVRLGAQVLQRAFPPEQRPPVNSIPGSVTGEVRKAWKLTGCLEAANPAVMEEVQERNPDTGEMQTVRRVKKKEDIRGITHLHHALDACVLGLTALYFPRHGTVWSAMVKAGTDRDADDDRRLWLAMTKRRPTPQEAALLKATGLYQGDSEGRMHLTDLPEDLKKQLRARLAEKRVVQHIPAERPRLESDQTVWRVFDPEDSHRSALRLKRWFENLVMNGSLNRIPRASDDTILVVGRRRKSRAGKKPGKTLRDGPEWRWVYKHLARSALVGLMPADAADSKLKPMQAVKELGDNYGLALLPYAPTVKNRWHVLKPLAVHKTLEALKAINQGHLPIIIRKGDLVEFDEDNARVRKRVFSVFERPGRGAFLYLGEPDALKRGPEKGLGALLSARAELLTVSYARKVIRRRSLPANLLARD